MQNSKMEFWGNKSPCGSAKYTDGVFWENESPCGSAKYKLGVFEETKKPRRERQIQHRSF